MKYYVFCAGVLGERVVKELLSKGLAVCAVIDNNTEKQGGKVAGTPICSVDALGDFEHGVDKLYIASYSSKIIFEISQQLKNLGLQENIDFFCAINQYEALPSRVPPRMTLPEGYTSLPSMDSRGKVIAKDNENRFFRYIPPEYADEYREIIVRLKEADFFSRFIVDTWESDVFTEQFPNSMFVEHQYIPVILSPQCWPPKMLFDCALWLLNLVIELDKAGLGLVDISQHHVTYHNGRFVFFDFGAIGLNSTDPFRVFALLGWLINPLVLMSCGQITRAYMYLNSCVPPLSYTDIKGYLSFDERQSYERIVDTIYRNLHQNGAVQCCNLLIDYLKSLREPIIFGVFSDYTIESLKYIKDKEFCKLQPKYQISAELIHRVKPESLIDLAGNVGVVPYLLQDELNYSICMDSDLSALDALWRFSHSEPNDSAKKHHNLPAPVFMDIVRLKRPQVSPPQYMGIPRSKHEDFFHSIQCDCALALSVIHYFVLLEGLTFEDVVAQFLLFTKKYLVVEFVDRDDPAIKSWTQLNMSDDFPWYTKVYFEDALSQQFDILDQKPSTDTRTLYLCVIK